MFGYVTANLGELTREQQERYRSVYCGICRNIRQQSSQLARLGLSYDMAFLSLLLMSLYEPTEQAGDRACMLHPIHPRAWVDNEYTRYSADMNVALAYYNFLDDWQDEGKRTAKLLADRLYKPFQAVKGRYPRQCNAMETCLQALSRLEKENCENPDLTANTFGALMAELMVYKEDFWSPVLRRLGMALGRFIYLLDAVLDYDQDEKKGSYNPFLAMGTGKDPERWEQYLVLTMAGCAEAFEQLPLVQDKALLDNILYSGVWVAYREKERKDDHHD